MKFFEYRLENSKLMLIQFAPKSSDPSLHSHGDDFQISIPLSGNPFVEYNRHQTRLDYEKRLITAPDEYHRHFANEEPGRVLLINLNRSFLDRVVVDRLGCLPSGLEFAPWESGSSESFQRIAQTMMKLGMTSSLEQTELQELEWELAHLLLPQHRGTHTERWRKQLANLKLPMIKQAIDFIHDHYADELTLDEIAAVSGLSKYHFIRLFREQLGITPSQYLNQVRLQRAEMLLRQSMFDLKTIAFESGFGSLNTLERLFKKKHGMTASEYRKIIGI